MRTLIKAKSSHQWKKEEYSLMRKNILFRSLITAALLILTIPLAVSAQNYRDRYYNPDYRNQYNNPDYRDQYNRVDLRAAINRLDNSSVRLENDLNYSNRRRVFGIFEFSTVDNTAVAEVRDFRRAVWQLRRASAGGRDLSNSYDEARVVLDQGARLDRYLRLRTGSSTVDADVSDLSSNLHVIADAYGISMGY